MKNNLEEVRNIFQQDKDEIIKKYSASGAGIGKEGKNYIIVVYTNNQLEKSDSELHWKNIPLQIKYIGNTKLL